MYHSPARRPLSAINNKANALLISPTTTAGSGGGGGGVSTTSSPKHNITTGSSMPRSASKASLEINREGRASLSFASFEPYRLPSSNSGSLLSASTKRARARTVSGVAPLTPAASPAGTSHIRSITAAAAPTHAQASPLRSPAAIGPTRRVRSKTLSRSQNHAQQHERKKTAVDLATDLENKQKRYSLTRLDADNVDKCLQASSKIAEENRLRLISTFPIVPTAPTPSHHVTQIAAPPMMLAAPSMQRSPASPVFLPSWHTDNRSASSSTNSQRSAASRPTDLPEQVEQLSEMITDLQFFLPQASNVTPTKLQRLRNAVNDIMRPSPVPPVKLEEAIKLEDDCSNNSRDTFFTGAPQNNDPFYINWPTALNGHDADVSSSTASSSSTFESMYYTPLLRDDYELADSKYSMSRLQQDIQDLELQWDGHPPPYPTTYAKDDEPALCPPRW